MDVEIQALAQSVPIRARFSFIFDGVLIRLPLHQPCTLNMKTPPSLLGLVVCEDSDGLGSVSSVQLETLEKISKKRGMCVYGVGWGCNVTNKWTKHYWRSHRACGFANTHQNTPIFFMHSEWMENYSMFTFSKKYNAQLSCFFRSVPRLHEALNSLNQWKSINNICEQVWVAPKRPNCHYCFITARLSAGVLKGSFGMWPIFVSTLQKAIQSETNLAHTMERNQRICHRAKVIGCGILDLSCLT